MCVCILNVMSWVTFCLAKMLFAHIMIQIKQKECTQSKWDRECENWCKYTISLYLAKKRKRKKKNHPKHFDIYLQTLLFRGFLHWFAAYYRYIGCSPLSSFHLVSFHFFFFLFCFLISFLFGYIHFPYFTIHLNGVYRH